ncbi:MAG: hypothetical protein KJO31_15790 [Gammaproteobacteria bacterium]|nr:hypothetical protein [Gammaproteobacteria bacterium]
MIAMHSTFNLTPGTSETEFRRAFDAFCEHLLGRKLMVGWRVMRRVEHDGYNADEPAGHYYLLTEFMDQAQAQACWDYVEADGPPIRGLHRAVREKTTDTSFFLASDIA